MKILIVGFYTHTYMPYIEKYENILRSNQIDFDVICFDRDNDGSITRENNIYTFHQKMGVNKFKKVLPYIHYISFVKQLIRRKKYDKLIVLTTVPAIFLYRILTHAYNGAYIFDFRDYSYEELSVYRKLVNSLVDKSYHTFISSKGFMHYLQESPKITLVHNISNSESKVTKAADLHKKDQINIGFVGYVRYFDVNSKLIYALKNDPRFMISYHGVIYDDCDLVEYAKKNQIYNVKFCGKYTNERKPFIYDEIDLINSIYSIESKEVIYAIPNRLYDAALYKRPIIAAKDTYLSEVIEKFKLGFSVDIESGNLVNDILKFIEHYDINEFTKNCEYFLERVTTDELCFNDILKKFIVY